MAVKPASARYPMSGAEMTTIRKPELYRDLARQLAALLAEEPDPIANAANTAALIYHGLPNLNWAGFYFRSGPELVLGPFQGKPACVRIPVGRGVCGTAAVQGCEQLVALFVGQCRQYSNCHIRRNFGDRTPDRR